MAQQPDGYDPKLDPIELVSYDPAWLGLYLEEEARLRRALAGIPGLRIDHCGSTSVPGLEAKPILDILIRVDSREDWPRLVGPIEGLGYLYWASNPDKDTLYFVKGLPPAAQRRTHHIHVFDRARTAELDFRDLLCRDPEVTRKYVALKRELADRFQFDRKAYTDAKTEFIQGALRDAGLLLNWKTPVVLL